MDDDALLRYSRQILLPQVGIEGQQRLLDSRVLIVGLGGLGSPVAMYLAAAGVGHLTLIDHDRVDLSNLQRQIVHDSASIGEDKVASAARRLAALNPGVRVDARSLRFEKNALADEIARAHVVVDASDNFATRFALNRACLHAKRALVSGAVIRLEGQVSVFRFDRAAAPCYRCLYPETEELGETCSQTGVLAPVPGIVGCIQATEALKILLDLGETLHGRLLLLDAATMEWRIVRLKRDPACPDCGRS